MMWSYFVDSYIQWSTLLLTIIKFLSRAYCEHAHIIDAFTVIPLEFGPGSGPIFQFNCSGSESHLLKCDNARVNLHGCGHEKDAVVMCGGMYYIVM